MGVWRESPSQDEPGSEDEGPSDGGAGGEWPGAQEAGPQYRYYLFLLIVAFHGGRALRSSQVIS